MSIRLSNSCPNCDHFTNDGFCRHHKTEVSAKHTCDSFDMSAKIKDSEQCGNCTKYGSLNCAHPNKAALGMLCAAYAPGGVS